MGKNKGSDLRLLVFGFLILALVFRVLAFKSPWPEGTKIRVNTYVSSEPSQTDTRQTIKLSGLYATVPLYPEISYGDRVIIEGVVEKPFLKDVKIISHQENSSRFLALRKSLLSVLLRSLPAPESSLVSGMVLGSKASLPVEYKEALKATGTSHVVVASGMNVTLMASFVLGLLLYILPRRRAIIGGIMGIWVYVLLVGIEAPVVRAAAMASIFLVGQEKGRLYSSMWALFLTSWIMLFINPSWATDLGFILSVVATLSLILFEVKIRKKINRIPAFFRESISTSLAAQIGVAPIIWAAFGQFNPMSPLINALVLWVVPIITVGGIIGATIGLIIPVLGKIVLLLIYPFALWFSTVVQVFT